MAPSQTDCLKVQCGCISQQQIGPENLYQCTLLYGSGVKNPLVAPCPSVCPPSVLPPTLSVPTASNQPIPVVSPAAPPLSAADVAPPLPDIARTLAPIPKAAPCSLWCDLNGAIRDNPVTAILILLGVAMLIRSTR